MIKSIPKPLRILDIGGTGNYWMQMGLTDPSAAHITVVNTDPSCGAEDLAENISFICGNGNDETIYEDHPCDVIFSNSVIEHIADERGQKTMADNIRSYSTRFYVQTPARCIPVEPHFLFPYFQFLPMKLKIFLIMKFNMGWFKKCRSKDEAEKLAGSIRLINKKEMKQLFPDALIITERFLGMPKSYIAVKK